MDIRSPTISQLRKKTNSSEEVMHRRLSGPLVGCTWNGWPDDRENAYPKTSQHVLVFQPLQRASHLLRGLIQLFLTFSAVAEGS